MFLWEASAALTPSFTLTFTNHNQLTFNPIYVVFPVDITLFQSFIFCMLFFVVIMHPHPLPHTLPHPLFPILTPASYSGWSQSKCLSRPFVFTVFSVFRLALLFPLGCWILSPSVLLSVCIALDLQCSPSSKTNLCDQQVVNNLTISLQGDWELKNALPPDLVENVVLFESIL